jgi:hypothetical protein
MTARKLFSRRHNFEQAVPISIREDAPEGFRISLRKAMSTISMGMKTLRIVSGFLSFESAVGNAYISLADAGSITARDEIHKALEDLAKRPVADLSGAVQHAMAGLECIANQAAGSSGLELGKVIKSRPDLFPPPLNDVVPKLYGYASNNGRHITEGGEPDFAEAELLVGTAAIVATYLAR